MLINQVELQWKNYYFLIFNVHIKLKIDRNDMEFNTLIREWK